jgi:hypothetical protein
METKTYSLKFGMVRLLLETTWGGGTVNFLKISNYVGICRFLFIPLTPLGKVVVHFIVQPTNKIKYLKRI